MAFVAAIASWREAATQQGAARGTHVAVREVWPQRLLDRLVFACAVGGVVVEGKGAACVVAAVYNDSSVFNFAYNHTETNNNLTIQLTIH